MLPIRKQFTVGHTFIKYKGNYDFDGLYKLVTNWITKRRYELQEKKYKDKTDNIMGNEVEIDLTGEKKETPFVRLWIYVSFHMWDYKEKEGKLHGETKNFTGGRITIDIETKVELDWQGKFKGSKAKKLLGKLYVWIMKKEFEVKNIDAQEYEALKLEQEVKKFLKMETDTHAYG